MRKQRTAHRTRLLLTILAGVLLAFGTFWLGLVMEQSGAGKRADQRNEPDYIVDRFSFVRMNQTGQPGYLISGTRLTHRPLDDSSEVEQPFMRSLKPGEPPMDMHADRARIDQGNSRVQLNGNVLVDRAEAPNIKRMAMRTEALTVLPDEDRMLSDRPVAIRVGDSLMTGIGMAANNATRQIDIAERMRIISPPVP
ncbi:MAG: LPS export ABC transporter periplasmic protein LptC [Pseudomonadota bacterium]